MESKAKIFGHAIHPVLIVFPLGLLGTAVIFDVLYFLTTNHTWSTVSFWMIVAGIIGGLVAALFGFIDYVNIPTGTRAKRMGLYHALINVTALAFFAFSLLARWNMRVDPPVTALICSVAGLMFALVGGWFGGELVERLGVSVYPDADLNAPNSMTHASSYEADVAHRDLHPTH